MEHVRLQTEVYNFLKTLPDHCHFFIAKNLSCQIVGIVRGQAICILIAEKRRLSDFLPRFKTKASSSLNARGSE